MAGRQELPTSIETLNHKVRLARVPQAPHHPGHLAEQRVMHCRNPHPFDRPAMNLISMMVGY